MRVQIFLVGVVAVTIVIEVVIVVVVPIVVAVGAIVIVIVVVIEVVAGVVTVVCSKGSVSNDYSIRIGIIFMSNNIKSWMNVVIIIISRKPSGGSCVKILVDVVE